MVYVKCNSNKRLKTFFIHATTFFIIFECCVSTHEPSVKIYFRVKQKRKRTIIWRRHCIQIDYIITTPTAYYLRNVLMKRFKKKYKNHVCGRHKNTPHQALYRPLRYLKRGAVCLPISGTTKVQ